jgi:prepilin-type N-terminal cleavage/methylation domain-containing protein
MLKQRHKNAGFTIVELLIVVVVIAILAAISIVAYTGITGRASNSAVQTDLRNISEKIAEYQVLNGRYPTGQTALYSGSGYGPIQGVDSYAFVKSAYSTDSNNIQYCEGGGKFAIGAVAKTGKVYYYSTDGGLKEYAGAWGNANDNCPGMLGSVSGTITQSYAYRQSDNSWSAMAK